MCASKDACFWFAMPLPRNSSPQQDAAAVAEAAVATVAEAAAATVAATAAANKSA